MLYTIKQTIIRLSRPVFKVIDCIRVWLKRNDVFFTVGCTTALSVMAIIVSSNANKIAQRQSDMDHQDRLAEFRVTTTPVIDKRTRMWEASRMEVYERAGRAKNTEVETVTWLEIDYSNSDGNSRSSRFRLDGYYDHAILSADGNGLIATISAEKNQAKEFALEDYIEETARFRHAYVSFKLKSFLKIKYLDFENMEQEDYFDTAVSPGIYLTLDTLGKYFDAKRNPFDSAHRIDLQNERSPSRILPYLE
ncbi:hypothetical protein ACTJKN_22750 [Pedobacter sp. 22163]|uniref:hypothetical protein n=1 Tax=Pedobacter sp. 22163 TaxID=3453883 RepID=UPI003F85EB9E